MINGLDNYIFTSPLSILNSFILILGIYRIGLDTQKLILNNFFYVKKNNDIYYYSFLFGIYIVSYFLYAITVLQWVNFLTFKIIAIIIYFLGLLSISNFLINKKFFIKFKNLNYYFNIILLSLFGLMLISLSPITHADSISYHVGSSINILNTGSFDTELLPMTSKLASIGELMIALGFALKLEQFGALLQFTSLFSLIPLFLRKKNPINYLILLIVLLTPITIFLISSPKPQLVQSVATLLIFSFLLKDWINYTKIQTRIIFSIIIFILAINVLTKYSFVVSSFILYSYCLYLMYKKDYLKDAVIISLIIFCITILPSWIHRYIYFDTLFLNLLLSPLPLNIYGYQELYNLLSPNTFNIISLIFPNDLGKLSTSYGISLFLIFFIKRSSFNKYKFFYLMIFVFFFIHYYLGSNLSRFFYEGYLWLMYILIIGKLRTNKYFSGYKLILKVQILLGIFLVYIAAYTLFPGSINKGLRDKVMTDNANGYSLAKWVNENVAKNDKILTPHTAFSLYNNKTYILTFTKLIDLKNKKSLIYATYLKKNKINKIVFFGDVLSDEVNFKMFEKCLGKRQAYKKDVGRKVGRNPYNKGKKYNGWIYELNYNLLPSCLLG